MMMRKSNLRDAFARARSHHVRRPPCRASGWLERAISSQEVEGNGATRRRLRRRPRAAVPPAPPTQISREVFTIDLAIEHQAPRRFEQAGAAQSAVGGFHPHHEHRRGEHRGGGERDSRPGCVRVSWRPTGTSWSRTRCAARSSGALNQLAARAPARRPSSPVTMLRALRFRP